MYAPELMDERLREVRAEMRRTAVAQRRDSLRVRLRRLRDRF